MGRISTCVLTEQRCSPGFQGVKKVPSDKINVDIRYWNTQTQLRMKNHINNSLQILFQVPVIIITFTINPNCSFWLLLTLSPTQR